MKYNYWTILESRPSRYSTVVAMPARTLRDTRALAEPETARDLGLRLEAARRQLSAGYLLAALDNKMV